MRNIFQRYVNPYLKLQYLSFIPRTFYYRKFAQKFYKLVVVTSWSDLMGFIIYLYSQMELRSIT